MSKYEAPYYTTIGYDEGIQLGVYVTTPDDYIVKSVKAMSYDVDGNPLKIVTVDIEEQLEVSRTATSEMLWEDYGIDIYFDFNAIDIFVLQSWNNV